MSYIKGKMTEGEYLDHVGKIHWIIFLKPLVMLGVSLLLIGVVEQQQLYRYLPIVIPYKQFVYLALLLLFFVIPFLKRVLLKWTTEIGVTNQRLLCKRGLIAIDLQGMPLAKIENIESKQTITGRIFGYGTVVVKGSGSTPIIIYNLASVMRFRDKLATLINR